MEGAVEVRFALRCSTAPYQALGIIFFGVLAWGFEDSFRSGKWGMFESTVLGFGFYVMYVLIGLWYRVGVLNGAIGSARGGCAAFP